MHKLISSALIATTLLFGITESPRTSIAGTCASQCGKAPLRFKPGQYVRVEVVNLTRHPVQVEKPYGMREIQVPSNKMLQIDQGDGTQPNISLVFWSKQGFPLKATLSKPNLGTLRVELRPEWRNQGDRAVYIRDDGRVSVL
ncbi:MAG: hypothetical protein AAF378_09445 [Cyanobacteria bacterium P01_A01_bin.84]